MYFQCHRRIQVQRFHNQKNQGHFLTKRELSAVRNLAVFSITSENKISSGYLSAYFLVVTKRNWQSKFLSTFLKC